jgi:glycosyltransferase involved in cell wall biosynthesis
MSGPVLLVAADFIKTGGMDRANLALARFLADRGHEVHLVGHSAAAELTALPNVTFRRAPKPARSDFLGGRILHRMGRRWAGLLAARGVRVIVNGGNCVWGDVNWVHYVHAAYEPDMSGGLVRRSNRHWNHRAYVREERAALLEARVVIVNSERTRRDVIERVGVPAARVCCIYLGIDRDTFRPVNAAARREAKARLGWSESPAIIFIGGLGDRRKGFDTLLAAWKQLALDPAWDAHLAVIGSGAELPEWKARVEAAGLSGQIRFLGFRSDVPAVLAACDAAVAPARYEPYGMAVQEALAMGLPAVASRGAGVSEHFSADLSDLLIGDPEDARELAARLRMWRARREEFEAAALALSPRLRAHTWDHMAAEMMEIIESSEAAA